MDQDLQEHLGPKYPERTNEERMERERRMLEASKFAAVYAGPMPSQDYNQFMMVYAGPTQSHPFKGLASLMSNQNGMTNKVLKEYRLCPRCQNKCEPTAKYCVECGQGIWGVEVTQEQ